MSETKFIYRPFGIFRFALALMVACQHGLHLLPDAEQTFFFEMGFGVLAVITFFCISGFIVAEACDTFYSGRYGNFLMNRFLRLVPAYIAALIVTVLVEAYLYHAGTLATWDYLVVNPLNPKVLIGGMLSIIPFFHTQLIGIDFEIIPFSWTLRVESLFYFIIFVVYAAHNHFSKACPTVCVPHMASALFLGIFLGYLIEGTGRAKQVDLIPYFLFGVQVYRLGRNNNQVNRVLTGFAACTAVMAFPIIGQTHNPTLSYQLPLLIVLFAVFMCLALRPGFPARLKTLDIRLGELSYPLYLNHFIVLLFLSNVFHNYGIVLYASGIILSIGLAHIMHSLVEVPFKPLRDKIRGVAIDNSYTGTSQAFP